MELYDEFERDKNGFVVLKRKYSELYNRTSYLTTKPMVHDHIYEYDIHAANLTMLRLSGKVDESTLNKLERMDKADREVTVGKMIKRNKEIWKIISDGIRHAKEKLFRANQIQDDEVLTIKNDAVFIIGRKLKKTTFGPIEFRMKNHYSVFQQFGKLEFYYDGKRDVLDIKGLNDQIMKEPDHQNGMLKFLRAFFKIVGREDPHEIRQFLIQFVHDYKHKKLSHCYYRELNQLNIYRTIYEISGFEYNLVIAGDSDLDMINGIYNYKRYLLPLIQFYI